VTSPTRQDFAGLNADLTPGQLLSFFAVMQALLEPLTVEQKKVIYFFAVMQALLEPLTVEQKKVIYAVKGSSQNILPPSI
jgi:hypothetical protein